MCLYYMEEERLYPNSKFSKYDFFSTFFHIYFLISMEFLPGIDNIHMEGTMSQIFDMVSRFDFITKNGKYRKEQFTLFIIEKID